MSPLYDILTNASIKFDYILDSRFMLVLLLVNICFVGCPSHPSSSLVQSTLAFAN